MIVTESNNGPCPHNVTNILCHVFASSSFKSKAFFVIVCIVSVARCVSHFMLQVTWVYYVSSLSCTYLLADINISHVQKKAVFSIVQIQSNNWNIPQGYHKLVYIACVHNLLPSEIHTHINLRYFMLRVNAMIIWIKINHFNIHIMYR